MTNPAPCYRCGQTGPDMEQTDYGWRCVKRETCEGNEK